jgi:hypothetical protein
MKIGSGITLLLAQIHISINSFCSLGQEVICSLETVLNVLRLKKCSAQSIHKYKFGKSSWTPTTARSRAAEVVSGLHARPTSLF